MAKTRRMKGTGSYDKVVDKNKKIFYRWRIGIFNPLDQKTHYKSIKAKSRAALDEKVKAWKEEFTQNGNLQERSKKMTVKEWTNLWLQTISGKLTDATVYTYTKTTNRLIIPNFGKQLLEQVSPLKLQQFFDGLLKDISPSAVRVIRAHFQACFEAAVRLGVIKENPVKKTIPPKAVKPKLRIPEEEEVKRLLAVAKSGEYLAPPKDDASFFIRKRNYLIILLAVSSGMREGEILGLTWSCIDETASRIEVKHTLQTLPSNQTLKAPKNGKRRTIVVPESVAHEIREWRKYQKEYAEKYKGIYENNLELVFTKPQGGFMSTTYFLEWDFRAMRVMAEIEGTRFHDLRHFFASNALARGVSVMAVSEQLGHSSINITLERYTHVLERSREEMKEMLNANPLFKTHEEVGEEPMAKNG